MAKASVTTVGRNLKTKTITGDLISDGLTHITIVVNDSRGMRSIKQIRKQNATIRYIS